MKRLFLFFILLISMISIVSADDYIIDGNKVYIDNSDVYLEAVPHTVWNSDVTVSLTTKSYSGNLNILFGFNTDEVTPKNPRYYDDNLVIDSNGTYNPAGWTKLNKDIIVINKDFNGKDRWYLLEDVSFTASDTRKLKFYMETYETTKYDIIAYPSIYGNDIISAYNNGHIMILDPWTGDPPVGGNAYYDFEEGSGSVLVNLWDYDYNGTVTSMTWDSDYPTFNLSGSGTDYSGDFDGNNDKVLISEFPIGDYITISFWIKTSSSQTGKGLIHNYNSVAGRVWRMYMNGNYINTYFYDSTNSNSDQSGDTSISLTDGEWHHVAYVVDGSNIYNYIDCHLEKTTVWSATLKNKDSNITIGQGVGLDTSYFLGNIDEVKIYSDAKNSTEIENICSCGSIECDIEQPINIITSYLDNQTVSDNFYVSQNIYFLVNNTLERECNITLYNGSAEVTEIGNMTVCESGCDYSTFTYNITHNHTDSPINKWTFGAYLCAYHQSTSATLNLTCGAESQEVKVPSDEIPDCSVTRIFKSANFSICNGTENITISITSNAPAYNKRLDIRNLTIGEEYDNITYKLTLIGNSSYLDEIIHYHDAGTKEIYAYCSDGVEDYHNITVSPYSPVLIKNRLDTDCYTIFYDPIYEGSSFEYCSSNLTFNEIIQYYEPLYWESVIYCNDTIMQSYNGTGFSIQHGLNESDVTDFQGQDNLSCYWNITLFDGFNLSEQFYFTIVDTVFPNCTGLDDGLSQSDGDYDLSVSCSDENFYSLNLSCSDGTDNYTTGISSELFSLDLMFSLTNDTVCSYEYCDGHPDDFNCVDGNFTLSLFMVEPVFETLVCPTDTTGNSILFTGLIFMAFLLLMVGIIVNKGIFTFVSGLLFIVLSFSLSACSLMIGALFGFVGLFLVITGSFRQVFF